MLRLSRNFLFLFIFNVLAFQTPLHAQILFYAGPSVSFTQESEYLINTSSVVLPQLGTSVSIPFQNGLSMEPGMMYSKRGYNQELLDNTYKVRLGYISIYADVVQHFWKEKWYVSGGFEYCFSTDQKIEGPDFEFGNKNFYKSNDMGLRAAIGYQISEAFSVKVSYFYGLLDNLQFDYVDEMGQLQEDTQTLKFRTLGLTFQVYLGEMKE